MFSLTSGREIAGSDIIMSLVELCMKGDLEGVKAALKSGADVNTKDEEGWTGLMEAVRLKHNTKLISGILRLERLCSKQSREERRREGEKHLT